MGKKSIVITTMEEKLLPYGFHYTKYQNGRWTFSRKVDGVSQNVFIQKGMWADNDYVLEINTSVSPTLLRIRDFIKDTSYDSDFFEFYNEEERRDVLEELGDLVIRYGVEKLKELSVIEEHYEATLEMNKKLFREQEILTRKFMERHGLNRTDEEAVMLAVKDELKVILEEKYEKVQDKLVELAAVYGNMLIDKMGGRWEYSEVIGTTTINKIPLFTSNPVMRSFVQFWENKDADLVLKEYKVDVLHFNQWLTDCRNVYGKDWQPPRLEK